MCSVAEFAHTSRIPNRPPMVHNGTHVLFPLREGRDGPESYQSVCPTCYILYLHVQYCPSHPTVCNTLYRYMHRLTNFFINVNFTAKHALTKIAKGIVKVCKEDVSSAVYITCTVSVSVWLLTVVTFSYLPLSITTFPPLFSPLSHDLSFLDLSFLSFPSSLHPLSHLPLFLLSRCVR